jgi:cytochrome c peroxidase
MKIGRVLGYVAISCLLATAGSAGAPSGAGSLPPFSAIVHQRALQVPDRGPTGSSPGVFPRTIPETLPSLDPSGVVETYNPGGPTDTRTNPFFQALGTNGRACVTCHEPRSAWGVSTDSIRLRFVESRGTDPIFRLVDGATCPTDDVSTLAGRKKAYRLLLSKGLIRIFLPLPDSQLGSSPPLPRDFEITAISDPYGCTDLSSDPAIISVYRRPLPSANLRFLIGCPASSPSCAPLAIMWDGREPSLASQATDATLGHGQAAQAPTSAQLAAIVAFESQLYDAQVYDFAAGGLDRGGADGGPEFLGQQPFAIGINDSLSPGFDNGVFSLFDAWQDSGGRRARAAARAAIARGQAIFNAKTFTIDDVGGLNRLPTDPLGAAPIAITCSTCHDTPNVGNHSLNLALDIGVTGVQPPALDVSGLPVFTVTCTGGPLAGQVFQVTDLGRALITGKCADVGKTKGPILRGLAGRAPYFHNGSAATLDDVVDFYDQRFHIGFSAQERADLVAFLKAL